MKLLSEPRLDALRRIVLMIREDEHIYMTTILALRPFVHSMSRPQRMWCCHTWFMAPLTVMKLLFQILSHPWCFVERWASCAYAWESPLSSLLVHLMSGPCHMLYASQTTSHIKHGHDTTRSDTLPCEDAYSATQNKPQLVNILLVSPLTMNKIICTKGI